MGREWGSGTRVAEGSGKPAGHRAGIPPDRPAAEHHKSIAQHKVVEGRDDNVSIAPANLHAGRRNLGPVSAGGAEQTPMPRT